MPTPFSVIVPIYKVRDYLDQCVSSIIGQTYRDIEIILVDDGSPDDCPDICDRFAALDSRITVIHKEHGGLVSARQEGARICRGEYVCCVDGDDFIADNYIEKMAAVIDRHHPDMVCCGHFLCTKTKTLYYKPRLRPGLYTRRQIEAEIFPLLLCGEGGLSFPPHLWAAAIRRELYLPLQLAVDPRIVIAEDVVCTKPCVYRSASIYMMAEPLYYHNRNPHSLTQVGIHRTWQGALLLVAQSLRQSLDMRQGDFQEQWVRSTTGSFFFVALSRFNGFGSYLAVRREILEMMDQPVFCAAIQRCHFRLWCKRKIIEFVLKRRWVFGLFLLRYAYRVWLLLRELGLGGAYSHKRRLPIFLNFLSSIKS